MTVIQFPRRPRRHPSHDVPRAGTLHELSYCRTCGAAFDEQRPCPVEGAKPCATCETAGCAACDGRGYELLSVRSTFSVAAQLTEDELAQAERAVRTWVP